MSTLEHPINTWEYPVSTLPVAARARAPLRTAAAGESSPEWGYPREYPVSTPWLGVPFEYPVSTRYELPNSECAHTLPTNFRRLLPQAPESNFAAAVSTLV